MPFFFTMLLALTTSQGRAQATKIQQEAVMLQKVLLANHYSPRAINDTLSGEIFKEFLNTLDPRQVYFTAADLKNFSAYTLTLDDELNGKGWKFFPVVAATYKQRLAEAAKICESLQAKPFNYTTPDKLVFNDEAPVYAATTAELNQRWEKWLKYQVLWQLVTTYDEAGTSAFTDKELMAREPQVKEKVMKAELRRINRIVQHPQGYEDYLKDAYFNAVSTCFDPHTNFFSLTDYQNFQAEVSMEGHFFGFDLDENDAGEVEIIRMVPGGPAWKSNELHQGDVIQKLKWKNKQAHDLVGASLEEVEAILAASNDSQLEITVKDIGGVSKTILLKKEKLQADDNLVKSFLLKGEKKVGYISLPGFYSDWNNASAQGCANDVAKEIVKLKKENIDGLIMDLRYNGGGSLAEGMNLAGIFIDEGPLLLMQGKDRKAMTLRDANRGTVYDGPLLVMVNGQSASASEIFAAAMQDYNRAVIAGSSTFGKATAQSTFPLDPAEKNLVNPKSPHGFANITQHKLFRVNGKTAQLNGVQPDVALPDAYEVFLEKEAAMAHALPAETLSKKTIYAALPAMPVTALQEKSKARLLQNEGFKKIEALRKSPDYRSLEDLKEVPLNLAFFRKLNKSQALWYSLLEKAGNEPAKPLQVENPPFNQALLDLDAYSKETNEAILENLKADIYLEESYNIVTDLIKQTSR